MEDHPTVIYVAGSVQQAYLLKNRLAEQGIQAVVANETLEKGSGVDYVGWQTLPRVLVDPRDAVVARRIALEHDRRGAEVAHDAALEDDTSAEGWAVPEDWPRCPQCGASRITRCPVCKTTGSDFPEADDEYVWGLGLDEMPEGEKSCGCGTCGGPRGSATEAQGSEEDESDTDDEASPGRLVLMCPTCSEPFLPEFPRHCAWCNHEFDDGFEPDEIVRPLPESNRRVAAIVVGLLVLAAAAVAYFMFVVSGPTQ